MGPIIRCQRQRVGRFALIGVGFILLPGVSGLAILLFLPGGMLAWSAATMCFLFAFLFAVPTLKMFEWVETDGHMVRGKRFFTRLRFERRVQEIAQLRAALAQVAEQGRDPALGAIRAFNYQIMFADRTFMFFSCTDMNDTDHFVETVIADEETGLRLPVVLGGTHLGGFVHFDEEAMGRSYAYFGQGHLLLTLYLYRADGPVADGIGDPRVREQFEQVKSVVNEMREPGSGLPAPKVREQEVTFGESPGAYPALCGTFEVDVDGELAESRIHITAWRQHLIKLRCTMPASYRNTWGPGLARFESALGQMLQQPAAVH